MHTTELKKLSAEIDKYKDLYNEMCDKYDTCGQCDIGKFIAEYSCELIPCEAVFMAVHLLGFSKETSDFIKQRYEDKNEMCSKTRCCDCDVFSIKCMSSHSNLICSEIYIALILLKDV